MLKFFETLLNMSITGAVIIAFVMIVRLFLKKLPRRYSYILWIIPAIRLLIPFSVAAPVSVFNFIHIPEPHAVVEQTEVTDVPALTDDIFTEPITDAITVPITDAVIGEVTDDGYFDSVPDGWYTGENAPQITGPVYTFDVITNAPAVTEAPVASDTPVSDEPNTALILWRTACAVWALGTAGMFGYLAYTFAATKKQIEFSYKIGDGLYSNAYIETPFVFGYIKPRIYVPFGLNDKQFEYVVAHEKTHIKRGDHIIKIIASLILCVHWFNPFAWLAFKLMTVDMELSCDERAINTYDLDVRKDYARALLNMSVVSKKVPFHGMLSFGESSIKSRIKGILRMKKPAAWACVLAVAVMTAAAVCLLTNAEQTPPDKVGEDTTESVETTEPADTDEPVTDDPPVSADTDYVKYSYAICADGLEYIVRTSFDGDGRIVLEEYFPEFLQPDIGYHRYDYDDNGRLVAWIMGGTISGIKEKVQIDYSASDPTVTVVASLTGNTAASVEFHKDGTVKRLQLGEPDAPMLYRVFDEKGRRVEELGDSPVPSSAYYNWDHDNKKRLIKNGVFRLYYNAEGLPLSGYFEYEYGSPDDIRTLYSGAMYEDGKLIALYSTSYGNVELSNLPSDVYCYSYTEDGLLLPGFAETVYNEKGQLVSVKYSIGTVTVDGIEQPRKTAYVEYGYDEAGVLVFEKGELFDYENNGELVYKNTYERTYFSTMLVLSEKTYTYYSRLTYKESGYSRICEYYDNDVLRKEERTSLDGSTKDVYEYDGLGQVVKHTATSNGILSGETTYSYGEGGGLMDRVSKVYQDEKLYSVYTVRYYSSGGIRWNGTEYYGEDGAVRSDTYTEYDANGRVLREKYYKGADPIVREYSYLPDGTATTTKTIEQAVDNWLLTDSEYTVPAKGGVNARQYFNLKFDVQKEFAGWVSWRYTQSPLKEQFGITDGQTVFDIYLEYVCGKDPYTTLAIAVYGAGGIVDVFDEMLYSPRNMSGTVSKAGELSADGKWQYYILDSNGTKYRFYAPVALGVKVGDKVTVTFNGAPSMDTDVDNVTLKVITDGASDGKEYNASGQLVKETVTETVDGKVHKTVHFYNYYTSEKAEDHITYFYINEVLQYVSKRLYYTSPVEALYMESMQYYNSDGSEGEYTFKRYTQSGMLVKERYYESGKPIEREYVYKDGVRSLIYTLEDAVKYWLATDSSATSPAKGGRNENKYSNLVIEYDPEYANEIAAQFMQGETAKQHQITEDCNVQVVKAKFSDGGMSDNSILVVVVEGADGIFRGISEVMIAQKAVTGGVAMIGATNADGTLREYTLFHGGQSYTAYMLPSSLDVEIGDKVRVSYLNFAAMKAQLAVKVLSAECLEDKSAAVSMNEYTTKIAVKNSDDPKVTVSCAVPSNWQNYGTVFNRNNIAFFRLEDYIYSVDNGIDVEGLKNYGDGTLSEVNVIEEKPGTDNDPFAYYVYLSWPNAISRDGMTELHRYVVENNGYYVTVGFFGDAEIPAETVDAVLRSVKVGTAWDDASVSFAPEGNIIYVRLSGGELFVNVVDFSAGNADYLQKRLQEYSYMPQKVITFSNKDVNFEYSPATISRNTEEFVLYNTCVNYTVLDGAIYTKDMSTLVAFPPAVTGEYTLPETVKSIDDNALYGSKLSKLIVPFGTRTGKLYGADNVVVEEDTSKLQGAVSDVGELTADGTGRKCLLQINVLHYAFTAPADMDIRVGDLVTVTFAGEVQKGRNGENNTLSVISHEDPNRTVTAVKHSFTVSVKNSPSLGKMNVDIEFPSDWERQGTNGTVLSRNGVKFFELSSSIVPFAMGIDETPFRTSTETEVTVIDEKYGTDGDPYAYYIYHSRPGDKYGPDASYDVHSYVVLSNGYYVTLGFLGDADIPQDVIDRVLRSVDVFADANGYNDGEISGELFGDIRYMAIKYGTLMLDVETLDEATVEHIKSFVDKYPAGTVTGIAFTNKNLSITCSPTRISERVLSFTVPENCIEYVTVDGVIYSSDNKVLIAMPPARAGSYSLPNAVERMDDYALYGSKLASLNIPALLNDRGALIGADNVKIYQK